MPRGRRNDGDLSKGWGGPVGHPPYPGCETGGRPRKWTDEEIEKQADAFWEFLEEPTSLFFEEFALKQKFNPQYLSRWAKINEKFSEVYEYAREWQKLRIKKGALLKKFDSKTAIFLLSAEHGLRAQEAIEHTGLEQINIIHYGDQPPKTWKEEKYEEKGKFNERHERQSIYLKEDSSETR